MLTTLAILWLIVPQPLTTGNMIRRYPIMQRDQLYRMRLRVVGARFIAPVGLGRGLISRRAR